MGMSDLDDDSEIDEVLYTEQEALNKRRIWEAHNKEWEEAREDPHGQGGRKDCGKRAVPGAESAVPAECAKGWPKLSSKINYAAVDSMMEEEDIFEAVARAKALASTALHAPAERAATGEGDIASGRRRLNANVGRPGTSKQRPAEQAPALAEYEVVDETDAPLPPAADALANLHDVEGDVGEEGGEQEVGEHDWRAQARQLAMTGRRADDDSMPAGDEEYEGYDEV